LEDATYSPRIRDLASDDRLVIYLEGSTTHRVAV
jgi:hypothetical protein